MWIGFAIKWKRKLLHSMLPTVHTIQEPPGGPFSGIHCCAVMVLVVYSLGKKFVDYPVGNGGLFSFDNCSRAGSERFAALLITIEQLTGTDVQGKGTRKGFPLLRLL